MISGTTRARYVAAVALADGFEVATAPAANHRAAVEHDQRHHRQGDCRSASISDRLHNSEGRHGGKGDAWRLICWMTIDRLGHEASLSMIGFGRTRAS
jgi:hypothetical protein